MPRKVKQPVPLDRTSLFEQTPSIYVLDRFRESDLAIWEKRSAQFDALYDALYHGLEPERVARRQEIVDALASRPAAPFSFDSWVRIVPYAYSHCPLSAAGSVRAMGGRFNIGNDCDESRTAKVLPALYIGDSHETAFRECYQVGSRELAATGLTAADLSLRKSDSSVRLKGHITRVFDMRDRSNLEPVVKVLKKFKTPPVLEKLARELKLGKADALLIRTAARLQANMQDVNWRAWPAQFGLPAPSQRLGTFLKLAGYEGIVYRSTKLQNAACLAVFPSNIGSDKTFVEVQDAAPAGVRHTRLDIETASDLCGWEFVREQDRDS